MCASVTICSSPFIKSIENPAFVVKGLQMCRWWWSSIHGYFKSFSITLRLNVNDSRCKLNTDERMNGWRLCRQNIEDLPGKKNQKIVELFDIRSKRMQEVNHYWTEIECEKWLRSQRTKSGMKHVQPVPTDFNKKIRIRMEYYNNKKNIVCRRRSGSERGSCTSVAYIRIKIEEKK